MSQITNGIRAILSNPAVYEAYQRLMGASRVRRELVDDVIRPKPGMRVLDVGCGTADILALLPPGVEYWGFDISQAYIDAARKRFGDRGRFHCGLLGDTQLASLPRFDVVLAVGVLHHMDDAVAHEFFALARRALAPGGRVVTIDPAYVQGQNPVARFIVSRDRGQNVRRPHEYTALAESMFASAGWVKHRTWMPFTHWVMECSVGR